MRYSPLGSSGLEVSRACLGTMTWGTQNTQQDADQQIAYALSKGVNFIDTAEMYSIPPTAESYGKTETIIGNWLARHAEQRGDIILASKIAPGLPWVRGGKPLSRETVIEAVDNSLQRLQTDYIDLYQLHWPNRTSPHFGKHFPNRYAFTAASAEAETAGMLDILQGLDACVKAGKIRYCGLSDDTPWGIATYLKLSEQHDLPRMVSIQNEFNLLHSKDWPYLVEHCVMENVAFLPWSPLAGGMLSGKYLGGARPEGSRWTMMQRNGLFRDTEASSAAIAAYVALAEKHGMTASQLAIAWCDQVDGVTSTIIGATTMEQLQEDIDAFDIEFNDELKGEVAELVKRFTVPF
ncbi:MAG: aldo/keto reductase [Pseudomonadales bacterium]|nr:aldo/keto reductase [Pseudomonadales bacterium]MCK5791884.1 aldo/keto reductase [Ketobacter sp.]HAG93319.1 aldo/keto reductase [Gammaproteobacteria bacterium]MAQ23821.1 aldo/keto reductase [Pseudomonadales bacterium]MBI26194.1 aldo/keto reductase [Pseudomonadales bacterium]|tara:strand:- start:80607 stop:81656 length:1050 start_codon:yes stop_codon:yes gene_type:complete